MTAATNTTLGEIKLSGDFLASNASSPTLRPSGVKADNYNVTDKIYVDAQGRVTWAKQLPEDFDWPKATKSVHGVVQIGVLPDPNNQSIDVDSNSTISLNIATDTDAGLIKVGDNLGINSPSGKLDVIVPLTTTSSYGSVKGDGTSVLNTGGTISISSENYFSYVGAATTTKLGYIKPGGFRLSADAQGVLSLNISNAGQFGGVSAGLARIGDNLSVVDGYISAPPATASTLGVIQPRGDQFFVDDTGAFGPAGAIYPHQVTNDLYGYIAGVSGANLFLDDATSTMSCNYTFSDIGVNDATTSVLGRVQIGDNFDIDSNGVLSVLDADASGFNLGAVKVSGRIFKVDGNGALYWDTNYPASAAYFGHVRPDGTTFTFSDLPTATITANISAIPQASASNKGLVSTGEGFINTAGTISLPKATTDTLGVVKCQDGGLPLISPNGELSMNYWNFPSASKTTKGLIGAGGSGNALTFTNGVLNGYVANSLFTGLVKCDNTTPLKISSEGLLEIIPDAASGTTLGTIKVDGISLKVFHDGDLSCGIAATSRLGMVKIGDIPYSTADGQMTISSRLASSTQFGVVKVGETFEVSEDSTIDVAKATYNKFGRVIIGPNTVNGVVKPGGLTMVGSTLTFDQQGITQKSGQMCDQYAQSMIPAVVTNLSQATIDTSRQIWIIDDASITAAQTTIVFDNWDDLLGLTKEVNNFGYCSGIYTIAVRVKHYDTAFRLKMGAIADYGYSEYKTGEPGDVIVFTVKVNQSEPFKWPGPRPTADDEGSVDRAILESAEVYK